MPTMTWEVETFLVWVFLVYSIHGTVFAVLSDYFPYSKSTIAKLWIAFWLFAWTGWPLIAVIFFGLRFIARKMSELFQVAFPKSSK